jgi:hypothetical protein
MIFGILRYRFRPIAVVGADAHETPASDETRSSSAGVVRQLAVMASIGRSGHRRRAALAQGRTAPRA